MSQEQISLAFEGAHIVDLVPESGMSVFDLAMKANCFKTERDAVRIITAGGLYINYERVTDPQTVITRRSHILPNNVTLLRTGKKSYHVVRWLQLRRANEAK